MTDPLTGLREVDAAARLSAEGPNALPSAERRSLFRVAFDAVREPMTLLLFGAAGLYVAFGDLREALTLLAFVVVVTTITIVQEGRTERTLDALRDLTSPRAQVLRDGAVRTIPGRDVVRGDVLRVSEGDRIPADAKLVAGTALTVDESLLTGESVPVDKLPDRQDELFSGTVVTSGRGVAEVFATGPRSRLGRIGESMRAEKHERSPLQKDVDAIVRKVAIVGLVAAIALALVRVLTGQGWLESLLAGITLAMALLPEEFPLVLTVFLALGARRLATANVLTRRVSAIETLGSVHVLCTDKTGTLTENRMTIAALAIGGATFDVARDAVTLPEAVHELVEFGVLSCPRDPFDPMEKAFFALADRTLTGAEQVHLHPRWDKVREYPLAKELLAVTHVWRRAEDAPDLVVATKGAPEAIFDLCHLAEPELVAWRVRVDELAQRGLRVLGIARSRSAIERPPAIAHDIEFSLLGLVGLADPVRADVPAAVASCRSAGVRVIMITGDHPATARAIARAAGIDAETSLTGAELDALSDEELGARLETTAVIARSMPEQKLRIVKALRARGLVVGMTGDGVNDAPALKAADIGIAMGERGTDVAREAASLVLTHDDFSSIAQAIRGGRRVYDNLRNAFAYIVSVHVPIAGLALVPALLGWEPLLAPAQVMLLELVIDPACSVVFEMEDEAPDVMQRPPRPADAKLFDRRRLLISALPGVLSLIGTLLLVVLSGARELGERRSMAFAALVFGNLAALAVSRSDRLPFWQTLRRRNRAFFVLLTVASTFTLALTMIGPLARFVSMAPLAPGGVLITLLVAVVPILVLDARKAGARQ